MRLQKVFGDKAPLRFGDRRDGKPIASGEHLHVGKLCVIAQRGKGRGVHYTLIA